MPSRSPYSSLPRLRRRSRWPVIVAVSVAVVTLGLVVRMINHRASTPSTSDPMLNSFGNASAQMQEKPKEDEQKFPTTPSPVANTPNKTALQKNPGDTIPSVPKAMASDKVREEFDKAASVIRSYFKSPPDKELSALLRHPDISMPRYREWSQKNRIVPAVPLRIGPQLGTADRLFVTTVKLSDGSNRLVALENTKDGYLLDWESFSAWGESRFIDLATASTEKPSLLRVTVKPSSATAPELGALSFTLTHPNERTTLAAYALPDVLNASAAGRRLRDTGTGMFTLRLSMKAYDVKSGWACVREVVSSGWVDLLPANTDPKTDLLLEK